VGVGAGSGAGAGGGGGGGGRAVGGGRGWGWGWARGQGRARVGVGVGWARGRGRARVGVGVGVDAGSGAGAGGGRCGAGGKAVSDLPHVPKTAASPGGGRARCRGGGAGAPRTRAARCRRAAAAAASCPAGSWPGRGWGAEGRGGVWGISLDGHTSVLERRPAGQSHSGGVPPVPHLPPAGPPPPRRRCTNLVCFRGEAADGARGHDVKLPLQALGVDDVADLGLMEGLSGDGGGVGGGCAARRHLAVVLRRVEPRSCSLAAPFGPPPRQRGEGAPPRTRAPLLETGTSKRVGLDTAGAPPAAARTSTRRARAAAGARAAAPAGEGLRMRLAMLSDALWAVRSRAGVGRVWNPRSRGAGEARAASI
jgi:hypothetical protein